MNDRQTDLTQGSLKFSKVAACSLRFSYFNIALQIPTPPVKVTDKVRDHFGIEISDGVKNK
jgi:hypothetical protein